MVSCGRDWNFLREPEAGRLCVTNALILNLSFTCVLLILFVPWERSLPATLWRIPWEDVLLVMHETVKVDLEPLSRSRPLLSAGCVSSELLKPKLGCVHDQERKFQDDPL